jgi:hypothetical protein
MADLSPDKLLLYRDQLAESIRVQLRAKPLGVEVPEEWIMDLANNQCGVIMGVYQDLVDTQEAAEGKHRGIYAW